MFLKLIFIKILFCFNFLYWKLLLAPHLKVNWVERFIFYLFIFVCFMLLFD